MLNFNDVLRKWENQGVHLLPPNDRATVINIFDSTGKEISEDVVDLYCSTGGMKYGASDDHLWSFWSLEQVVKENKPFSRPGLFFADFLIGSHYYLFHYESPKMSSVWLYDTQELLAESVRDFFEIYLKNPGSLAMLECPNVIYL